MKLVGGGSVINGAQLSLGLDLDLLRPSYLSYPVSAGFPCLYCVISCRLSPGNKFKTCNRLLCKLSHCSMPRTSTRNHPPDFAIAPVELFNWLKMHFSAILQFPNFFGHKELRKLNYVLLVPYVCSFALPGMEK